jgi:sulfur-oxidizing protein SoxY
MDQITRLYIPALYVNDLKIFKDDELLLEMEGGISISENPIIRFSYRLDGATLRAEVHDSSGKVFSESWPIMTDAM